MPNPTSQVPSTATYYEDTKGYWPLIGGATVAKTYQTGQLLGVRSDGYAGDMDDSAALKFLGILHGHNQQVDAGDANGRWLIHYDRPHKLRFPLNTGTANRNADLGKPVYAFDAGKVTLNPAAVNFQNVLGWVTDVIGTTPELLSG